MPSLCLVMDRTLCRMSKGETMARSEEDFEFRSDDKTTCGSLQLGDSHSIPSYVCHLHRLWASELHSPLCPVARHWAGTEVHTLRVKP